LNKNIALQNKELSTENLSDLIVDCIQDIKGKNIIKMDLRKLEDAPTDFFIICEGDSSTQIKSISQNIYKRLKEEAQLVPFNMEGVQNAHWILIDYFNVIVHIFYPETRNLYELEKLWNDAFTTEYSNL